MTDRFDLNSARIVTARLVAAYGDHRVADANVRTIWLHELVEAFEAYPAHEVIRGMGKVIRQCKYWPTINEIISGLRPDVPPPQLPRFREAPAKPLTPEEMEARGVKVAAMKAQYGYDAMVARPDTLGSKPKAPDELKVPLGQHIMELSEKHPTVSPELKALLKKQRSV